MAIEAQKSNFHESPKKQITDLVNDVTTELKHEFIDIRAAHELVDSPQADLAVRRHVTGLMIFLFFLVAVVLLVSIGAIAWYTHAHAFHATPGMIVAGHLLAWV